MMKAGSGWFVAAVIVLGGVQARADDKADNLGDELLKLNRVTGEDAQKTKLLQFIKDKARARKGVIGAVRMMKAATDEKPFNFNGALILAKAAHVVREYDAAEYLYEFCILSATKLKSGSKMTQAYEGLMDMYWDAKKYQAVIGTAEKFLDLKEPEEVRDAIPFVMERLVQAKTRAGQPDEALRMAGDLAKLEDVGWYFAPLKGWVLRESGKTDQAVQAYQDAIDKLDASKKLKDEIRDQMKDQIRYSLSGLYVEIKDIDKAALQLQTLVKRHPDNPTYKNDLGFIWCDNDKNLAESEKLIRQALELDKKQQEKLKADGAIDEVKENAAYLDSLGWVLYKQQKYKEAIPILKRAVADDEEGNHLEIWDHLADSYRATGQLKDAVAAWEKGLKCEDLGPRDAERRRKVTTKLNQVRAELRKGD